MFTTYKGIIMPRSKEMAKYDLDSDGVISEHEVTQADRLTELELREQKAATQKKMAWTSLVAMVVFTAFLFLPIVPDSRVDVLGNILDLFYLAQAGIIGAYMGVQAWLSRK
jgi:hypothetical protein